MRLSVLDQSPIISGQDARRAIEETLALARRAEELGYTRYWLAEHHAIAALGDPCPEILVARLGAETRRLRIGTGGVLLPYYSAFRVAESFRLLEALFGVKTGLLLTGTVFALVYAYLVRLLAVALQTTEAGLLKITPSMEHAARSLGSTAVQTLARVHVPLLAPSLATAALLVFVDVLKELPATFALRPFNFDTLAIEAYNLAKDERLAEASVPSLVIVAVGLLPVVYVSKRYFQATRS